MQHTYYSLFKNIPEEQPSENIVSNVMVLVEHAEVRRVRIQTLVHGTFSVAIVGACIPAFTYLATNATNSGFFQYISLFTTDSTYVISHAKDVILSIADSLPVFESIMSTSLVIAGIYSLKLLTRDISGLYHKSGNKQMAARA